MRMTEDILSYRTGADSFDVSSLRHLHLVLYIGNVAKQSSQVYRVWDGLSVKAAEEYYKVGLSKATA